MTEPYFDPNAPDPVAVAKRELREWCAATAAGSPLPAAVTVILDELDRVTIERDRLMRFREAIFECVFNVTVKP